MGRAKQRARNHLVVLVHQRGRERVREKGGARGRNEQMKCLCDAEYYSTMVKKNFNEIMYSHIHLSVITGTVNCTYEFSGISMWHTSVGTERIRLGPFLVMDCDSRYIASLAPVSLFSQFEVAQPNGMLSVPMEGCHVAYSQETVGTAFCTYRLSNTANIMAANTLVIHCGLVAPYGCKLGSVFVQVMAWHMYRQVSNIRRTLAGNYIVDHSDVVGASPVGAAPTTSSFST